MENHHDVYLLFMLKYRWRRSFRRCQNCIIERKSIRNCIVRDRPISQNIRSVVTGPFGSDSIFAVINTKAIIFGCKSYHWQHTDRTATYI